MNGINMADMKILCNIIFWAFHYDYITAKLVMLHFNCKEDFAEAMIVALHSLGVINKQNPSDKNEPWQVMYNEIGDIPNDMLNILQVNGFTIKQISDALKGLPKDQKKISSNILSDKTHEWHPIETRPENELILIRMQDRNKPFMETRTEIVYLEDLKIAKYDNGWKIEPPFPLFDFSLCSQFKNVNDGVEITHWAKVTQKEIDGWHRRFDPKHEYGNLILRVDGSKLKEMYRSLVLAASCVSTEAINYPEGTDVRNQLQEVYDFLCDLQTCMDRGGDINALANR